MSFWEVFGLVCILIVLNDVLGIAILFLIGLWSLDEDKNLRVKKN